MMRAVEFIQHLSRDERGATAIEYGLIVALICLAIMTALREVADENTGIWAQVSDAILSVM